MFRTSYYIEKFWSLSLASALIAGYFLLGVDSIKSSDTVEKYLILSSRDFFIALIAANLFCRLMFRIKLPVVVENLNTYLIIPLSLIACVVLPFIDYFTYTNFSYSRLFINYQQVSFIALGSILVSILNSDLSWLKSHIKFLIFLSAPIFIFSLLVVRLWPNDVFMRIVKEDSLIENAQFLVLIAAAIFAFFNSLKLFHIGKIVAGLYLIASLGLFFVAGDEISWGQRLFRINTPAGFFDSNAQGETNIHNLSAVNNLNGIFYILVGLFGSFSWLVIPGLSDRKFWSYLSPPWFLSSFFFAGLLYNFAAVVLMFGSLGEWSEVAELMLYTGTFLFFAQTLLISKKTKAKK